MTARAKSKNAQKETIKSDLMVKLLILISVFLACLLTGPAFLVRAAEEKTVLFISSYSESFVSVPAQIAGIQSVFDEQKINLEIEYMDTKRLDTPENKQVFYQSLKLKLAQLPPMMR